MKTIPELCYDLMLKRDICAKPLGRALRWTDYSNYCAEAVPLLVEEIRRLQALLDKAPQGQEWQPIEKAPKTGESILVYCHFYRNIFCVTWDEYEESWMVVGGRGNFLYQELTHWQPRPDPPSAAEPAKNSERKHD